MVKEINLYVISNVRIYVCTLVSNRFPFKLILKTDYIAVPQPQQEEFKLTKTNDVNKAEDNKKTSNTNHWNFGLLQSMNNPELKVLEKSDHVVIKVKALSIILYVF